MIFLDDVSDGDRIQRLYRVRDSELVVVRHMNQSLGLFHRMADAGVIGGEIGLSVHHADGRECFDLSYSLMREFGGVALDAGAARRIAEWVRSQKVAAA